MLSLFAHQNNSHGIAQEKSHDLLIAFHLWLLIFYSFLDCLHIHRLSRMDLSRFLNTSIDLSASFVQRVVRVPKDAIREVIRNMPHEFFFFGKLVFKRFLEVDQHFNDQLFFSESLKRSPAVIEPDWFHPEVSNTNVEFRNYLLRTFAPNQFRTLETSCYLFVEKIRDVSYLNCVS